MSKNNKGQESSEVVDYTTVTNKNLLVKHILELQAGIQAKSDSLDREIALREEFRNIVDLQEKGEPAQASRAKSNQRRGGRGNTETAK